MAHSFLQYVCIPEIRHSQQQQHIQNLCNSSEFLTKVRYSNIKNNTIRSMDVHNYKCTPRKAGSMAGMMRNPCSFFCHLSVTATVKVKVTTDVLPYLCYLLVCGSLILHCWLNSTWGPVFIFQPLPHFGRWWTMGRWIIPSMPTALLLTGHYSRWCGGWWCCHNYCRCWLWFQFSK